MNNKNEKFTMTFKKLNKQLSNLDKVKDELVRLTVFAQEETKDLEAQPVPDVDKQKQEIDACRAEKVNSCCCVFGACVSSFIYYMKK